MVVRQVGAQATIQDAGRFGHLRLGFTEGGVTDPWSMKLANLLVHNSPDAAIVEIALGGLVLETHLDGCIALTGACCDLFINEAPVTMASRHAVRAGDCIKIGRCHQGVYSYLAISGGIESPPVLGSRSTVLRELIGGISGHSLRVDDHIPIGKRSAYISGEAGMSGPIEQAYLQKNLSHLTLRVLPGFDYQEIDPTAVTKLLGSEFTVTGASNRMAIQLAGPPIHTGIVEAWSEGTCYGCVQIPGDGQPLVLLNDRQTMGGYPKFGAINPYDCVRLAQARPGCTVRFESVSLEQAERLQWLETHYQDTLLRSLGVA